MKRIVITVGLALLVAIPATVGLVGNTSFAQNVPVRIPAKAQVVDERGGLRASDGTTELVETNSVQPSPGPTEPRDDRGGQRPGRTTMPANGAPNDTGSGKSHNGGHGPDSSTTDGSSTVGGKIGGGKTGATTKDSRATGGRGDGSGHS